MIVLLFIYATYPKLYRTNIYILIIFVNNWEPFSLCFLYFIFFSMYTIFRTVRIFQSLTFSLDFCATRKILEWGRDVLVKKCTRHE